MQEPVSAFDKMVIGQILLNKSYGSEKVFELTEFKTLGWNEGEYLTIVDLIKNKDFNVISDLTFVITDDGDLSLMTFYDEYRQRYLATVFDSDALEQNPYVIDIFRI